MGKVKEKWLEQQEAADEPNPSEMPESWEALWERSLRMISTEYMGIDAPRTLLKLIQLQHQTIEQLKERVNALETHANRINDVVKTIAIDGFERELTEKD